MIAAQVHHGLVESSARRDGGRVHPQDAQGRIALRCFWLRRRALSVCLPGSRAFHVGLAPRLLRKERGSAL